MSDNREGVTLHEPRLIICEGITDAAFFTSLIEARSLNPFQIISIGHLHNVGGISGGGIDALPDALRYIRVLPDFSKTVRNIAIVADSDGGQADDFAKITGYIKKANKHDDVKDLFPIPEEPFKKKQESKLSMTVLMLPGDNSSGAIESLLWKSLERRHVIKAKCVQEMIKCAKIVEGSEPNQWSKTKIDKAQVNAILAILYRKNPAIPLWNLWGRQQTADLVPLGFKEHEFDAIASHLSAI